MTREERHIAVLNIMLENMDIYDSIQPTTERKKAIEAAIQALSQEPTSEMVHVETLHQVMWERDIAIEQLKELGYSFGQKIEPCDDAISREDVIHYLECHKDEIHSDVLTFVKHLPSVSTTKNIVNHGTMNITL